MSLFKNVNVVSFDVTDWERAKKFYSEVLEWPIAYADDQIGWIEWGKEGEAHVSINRWQGPGPVPVGGGTTLVLAVDNAAAVTEALRARGVRCDDAVNIPGVIMYGTFYDPDGNRIQFASSAA